jgi:hypothetical protein
LDAQPLLAEYCVSLILSVMGLTIYDRQRRRGR